MGAGCGCRGCCSPASLISCGARGPWGHRAALGVAEGTPNCAVIFFFLAVPPMCRFPHQGWNPCLLQRKPRVLTSGPPGKSPCCDCGWRLPTQPVTSLGAGDRELWVFGHLNLLSCMGLSFRAVCWGVVSLGALTARLSSVSTPLPPAARPLPAPPPPQSLPPVSGVFICENPPGACNPGFPTHK